MQFDGFKLIGPNQKIGVEAYDDPRLTGVISFGTRPLDKHEEIASERTSLVVKKLRVVRMADGKRNMLVGHLAASSGYSVTAPSAPSSKRTWGGHPAAL